MLKIDFKRLWEFFEGDGGGFSMTRLLCFLSFFPSTAMAYQLHSENALLIYVGTFAVGYLGKEGIAAVKDIKSALPVPPVKLEKSDAAI